MLGEHMLPSPDEDFIQFDRDSNHYFIIQEKLDRGIKNFKRWALNTDEPRKRKLHISLTSFPQRMIDIKYCLYSLMRQTIKPDSITLWLAEDEFPELENSLPDVVAGFKDNGLSIRWCRDIGPYTKLIPALREYPEDIIVTADDDLYYPPTWLERLYESYLENPDFVHCHRAHLITLDNAGNIRPYNEWKHCMTNVPASDFNFATGAGGVLYPPHVLCDEAIKEELFTHLAPTADDVWFWAMAIKKGTKINIVPDNIKRLVYINLERELGKSGEAILVKTNVAGGKNDVYVKNVISYCNIKLVLPAEAPF